MHTNQAFVFVLFVSSLLYRYSEIKLFGLHISNCSYSVILLYRIQKQHPFFKAILLYSLYCEYFIYILDITTNCIVCY